MGTVVAFDERRGLGEIAASDGARYRFHCTAIADGTRSIPIRAAVVFTPVPGPTGSFEAGAIRPAADGDRGVEPRT
jgi:hypothetical protein